MIEIYTVTENPYKLGERNTKVYANTFPIINTLLNSSHSMLVCRYKESNDVNVSIGTVTLRQ